MPRIALNSLVVKNLNAPAAGQLTYWDTISPLGLRVSDRGARTFIVMVSSGKRRTIGRYPDISLQQAREAARTFIAEKTLGILRRAEHHTFEHALVSFLSDCEQRAKPRTVTDYKAFISRHFKFGKRKLDSITTAEISKIVGSLRDTPTEQNHAFTALSVFLRWAYRREMIPSNPMERLTLPARLKSRERVLADHEFRAVWNSTDYFPFGYIVRLAMLLGQRRTEIASLKWEWIDAEENTITFPAEVIKNNRTHTIPYGSIAADIFAVVPRQSDFLFPGRDDNDTFQGWSRAKKSLDMKSGVSGYTLHDLRRDWATRVAKHTLPHILERILNHSSGEISGVAAIYNRFQYISEMRQAIERHEKHLLDLLASS